MKFESIAITKVTPDATLPTRAHADDAGMDLYGLEDAILAPGEGKLLRTGIAMAIEPGFVGMIADRSSMAKKGVKTAGGIIDAGYRGEVQVVLWNISRSEVRVTRGDRIAQMLLLPIATPAVREVSSLDETTRGTGGFGSSGR
jgi:dUTP pyrophosphatase